MKDERKLKKENVKKNNKQFTLSNKPLYKRAEGLLENKDAKI